VQHNGDSLPPYCPEAERGVLGCCLLDIGKATVALKAGVTQRWFYDSRHAEVFNVLSSMALDGGGDALVATLLLRERGKLDGIGGVTYLSEQKSVIDRKWQKIGGTSRNSNHEKDQ